MPKEDVDGDLTTTQKEATEKGADDPQKPLLPNNKKTNDNKLPPGYIRWSEPQSLLSKPENPGEKGIPVRIMANESSVIQKAYKEYGFNQYVSDKISLHRSVPDIRPIRYDGLIWYCYYLELGS